MAEKKCPVDRGMLLIGLECCRSCGGNECRECPYDFCAHLNCTMRMAEDALAYIGWLEEKVEQLGTDRANLLMTIERELEAEDDPTAGAIITVPIAAISRSTLIKLHQDVGGLSFFSFNHPEHQWEKRRNKIITGEAEEDAGNDHEGRQDPDDA